MQKGLYTGKKNCGKSRNCSFRAISPFPTVFSKGLYCRHVKTRACLGKGEIAHKIISNFLENYPPFSSNSNVICKLFQFGKVYNLSYGKNVGMLF